ncbi:hypothetical protein [Roseivirga misakiensis]|uniref:Lipoprotein n=1 Tax=Roseivirga misakiensis TaxID=1563681 RepID=A0A1E5T5D3_9BACT|nr:hypothetical protein [Roseivirga misakiensis]OEK06595.1 hypothetical protein BFP71_02690 [Roseivirga misakiensis]
MNRKSFQICVLLLLFLSACQVNQEVDPSYNTVNDTEIQNSPLLIFEKRINDALALNRQGESVSAAIHERLGSPFMEAFAKFKTNTGFLVGFIPVFRKDSKHTEAIIISTIKEDTPHYTLLERGYLFPYDQWNLSNNELPTLNALANIFISFDKVIFNNNSSLVSEIIGSESSGQKNQAFTLVQPSNDHIEKEWVGTKNCLFTFTGTREDPYQELTNIDCQTTWTWERVPSQPEILDAGGGGGGGTRIINMTRLKNLKGKKPLKEYNTKCSGFQDMWNSYPNQEVFGYITTDGKVIMTDILSENGGSAGGLYEYEGTSYYSYPASQGKPSQSYAGMVKAGPSSNPYYLIPVSASVHTHSPCRSDESNGISHNVGNEDKVFASTHTLIKHYVIGCDAIGEYNGTKNSFFNKKLGNIDETCKKIN